MSRELLLGTFPYLAALLCAVGLAVRWTLARGDRDAARARAAAAWSLFGGGRVWRVALVVLAGAHLFGLLLPRLVLAWNAAPLRLFVLEGAGLVLGLLLLGGWARVMARHLARRHGSRAGDAADSAWLSLLFVAIASGLVVAVRYRWASSWSGATLSPYLASLLRGAPATELVERMPFFVQLHVVSLFALAALLPFTGVALLPILAADRLARVWPRGARRAT